MESSDNSRFGGVLPEDPQSSIKKIFSYRETKKKSAAKIFDVRQIQNSKFKEKLMSLIKSSEE